MSKNWLFVNFFSTVEWGPTLSAGRKILIAAKTAHYRRPRLLGGMVLIDRGFPIEIAQFQLGNLAFNMHTLHGEYPSILVLVLWDI
jgi:hypothetical protein